MVIISLFRNTNIKLSLLIETIKTDQKYLWVRTSHYISNVTYEQFNTVIY